MRERLTTLIGAAIALGILGILLFQPSGEPPISRPTTEDSGRNGYLVLAEWLRADGIAFESYRERLDGLQDRGGWPDTGNVLLTTMPHRLAWRRPEIQAVRSWIRDGNTLVVLAALDDSPEWATTFAATDFLRALTDVTGLRFEVSGGASGEGGAGENANAPDLSSILRVRESSTVRIDMRGGHPLSDGVSTLLMRSDAVSSIWRAEPADYADTPLLLALADEALSGESAIWHLPLDRGNVVVVASGSLLVNSMIGRADNSRFFANLVGVFRSPGGRVVFDDMHQGLSSLYDPDAFYSDSRLHATIGILIATWLAYLLGSSNRLTPPIPSVRQPRQSDLLRAVGGFLARRSDRNAVGRMLLDEWLAETLRARAIRPGDWSRLRALPSLGPTLRGQIEHCLERLDNGRPVSLTRLHNLLAEARKAIG